jgi:hypothetical protein
MMINAETLELWNYLPSFSSYVNRHITSVHIQYIYLEESYNEYLVQRNFKPNASDKIRDRA